MAPRGPFANPDPRKARITLGHLLTHSAGLACDDNAETSPGNEDAIEADRAHPDWTKVTLDLPMAYEPGAHYAYCSDEHQSRRCGALPGQRGMAAGAVRSHHRAAAAIRSQLLESDRQR